MLVSLLFASAFRRPMDAADLRLLARQIRLRHERDALTGAWVSDGLVSLHALEGERAQVNHAFDLMRQDARLERLMLIGFGDVAKRAWIDAPLWFWRLPLHGAAAMTRDAPGAPFQPFLMSHHHAKWFLAEIAPALLPTERQSG